MIVYQVTWYEQHTGEEGDLGLYRSLAKAKRVVREEEKVKRVPWETHEGTGILTAMFSVEATEDHSWQETVYHVIRREVQ